MDLTKGTISHQQKHTGAFAQSNFSGVISCGYKGFAGAITGIAVHPGGLPYMAATSMDRFLRIYDLKTRRVVQNVCDAITGDE